MPRENKHSRGRREEKKEKKRKRENGEDETLSKRQKPEVDTAQEVDFIGLDSSAPIPYNDEAIAAAVTERPFYGMLEDEEQEYFRMADEKLDTDYFEEGPEDRFLFLKDVWRMAEGKELKLACSQSCSRLLEKLILLSGVEQKKKLFGVFADNFAHLVQHRFASHCCETLFIQSAPIVTEELIADFKKKKKGEEDGIDDGQEEVSMESLFLQTLDELEGQMTFLLTDRFASHALRVLMVILSGRPLEVTSTKSLLQSKKKERILIQGKPKSTQLALNQRAVPSSFQYAIQKILSDTVATMDTSFIRVLATHPTGNPTLQLLLELELTDSNTKKNTEKTIIAALLPGDIATEGSEASVFVNGIIYDAIGSRLLETICTFAPGKLFKQIYKSIFKDRIAALARNEISSYVVIKVLQRLSKEDLEKAVEQLNPQIAGLVQRNRTVVIKTLLGRCHTRNATGSIVALTTALSEAYESTSSSLVLKMACMDDAEVLLESILGPAKTELETGNKQETKSKGPKPTSEQIHGSALAQTLLSIPGSPSALIQNSLLAQSPSTLLAFSLFPATTHIIQSSLIPTHTNAPFRRKLVTALLLSSPNHSQAQFQDRDPIFTLALHPVGSHVLDAILQAHASIFSLIERIALVLTKYEYKLKQTEIGRIVCHNWMLDQYKTRRGDWVSKVKALGVAVEPSAAIVEEEEEEEDAGERKLEKKGKKKNKKDGRSDGKKVDVGNGGRKKTAIELAREKFAANKLAKENSGATKNKSKGKGFRTGANSASKIGT